MSPVEHGDVEGERASLRGGAHLNQSFMGSHKLAAPWPIGHRSVAADDAELRRTVAHGASMLQSERERANGPSVLGARHEQDEGVSEARQGRSRSNRRRTDFKQASSSVSIDDRSLPSLVGLPRKMRASLRPSRNSNGRRVRGDGASAMPSLAGSGLCFLSFILRVCLGDVFFFYRRRWTLTDRVYILLTVKAL
jgi:hypothetical protein